MWGLNTAFYNGWNFYWKCLVLDSARSVRQKWVTHLKGKWFFKMSSPGTNFGAAVGKNWQKKKKILHRSSKTFHQVLNTSYMSLGASGWIVYLSDQSHGSVKEMVNPICMYSFKKIYFNWRLITLQYCGSFCHSLTWISHGCTCVTHREPPPTSLPIPSLWVVPGQQLEVPCFMHRIWIGDLFHIW